MRKKNYNIVLVEGTIKSVSDGQEHYITALDLARLYGVSYRKCIILRPEREWERERRRIDNAIYLYPQKYSKTYVEIASELRRRKIINEHI